jgi:hypothetical protein
MFPKGFDYYAGGHIHIVSQQMLLSAPVIYPGPLFPNNFSELEELHSGGFYIADKTTEGLNLKYILSKSMTCSLSARTARARLLKKPMQS